MTTPAHLGTYPLGFEHVRIMVDALTDGGSYVLLPAAVSPATITIGTNDSWEGALDTLYHECVEMTLDRLGCQYRKESREAADSSAYIFVISHVEMAELTARISKVLPRITQDLRRAWLRHKKARETKAKKEGK